MNSRTIRTTGIPFAVVAVIALSYAVTGAPLPQGLASSAPAHQDRVLVLRGAKVYPSPTQPPIPNATVIIRDGKIVGVYGQDQTSISKAAKVLDCTGLTILSGFQNSHVHFTEQKWVGAQNAPAKKLAVQLQDMLTQYGFTTIVDTGSDIFNTVALRKRIESGEIPGPRILTAGDPLYPHNGIPYYLKDTLPPEIVAVMAQPATPQEAIAAVQFDLSNGADIIKLFTGSWIMRGKVLPMDPAVAAAAVVAAHQDDKLVFSHPSDLQGFLVALNAGVDVLAHSVEDLRGWKPEYIQQMIGAHMAMIPTLHLFGGDDDLPAILQEVGDFQKAGGQILFGTDVGYLHDYDPSDEYVLMQRAGLTFPQILASLTTAPAERFKESSLRGRVAAGKQADLVVLQGDPAVDVHSFTRVQYTIRSGKVIYSNR
jgi:imidazolonepropionase-like amidohydrolase